MSAPVPDTTSLPRLAAAAAECTACELYKDAEQTVFGEGPSSASVLLVGEQPGDVEDREGHPFVGPAGRVLDRGLRDAGIDRDAAYVTNAVKHFRFARRGNRRLHETPQAVHITACRPWLQAEMSAVAPKLVVCLGATAVKGVLGTKVHVMKDRGTVMERDSLIGPGAFLVTIHPSAVLRAPDDARDQAYAAFVRDLAVGAQFL